MPVALDGYGGESHAALHHTASERVLESLQTGRVLLQLPYGGRWRRVLQDVLASLYSGERSGLVVAAAGRKQLANVFEDADVRAQEAHAGIRCAFGRDAALAHAASPACSVAVFLDDGEPSYVTRLAADALLREACGRPRQLPARALFVTHGTFAGAEAAVQAVTSEMLLFPMHGLRGLTPATTFSVLEVARGGAAAAGEEGGKGGEGEPDSLLSGFRAAVDGLDGACGGDERLAGCVAELLLEGQHRHAAVRGGGVGGGVRAAVAHTVAAARAHVLDAPCVAADGVAARVLRWAQKPAVLRSLLHSDLSPLCDAALSWAADFFKAAAVDGGGGGSVRRPARLLLRLYPNAASAETLRRTLCLRGVSGVDIVDACGGGGGGGGGGTLAVCCGPVQTIRSCELFDAAVVVFRATGGGAPKARGLRLPQLIAAMQNVRPGGTVAVVCDEPTEASDEYTGLPRCLSQLHSMWLGQFCLPSSK